MGLIGKFLGGDKDEARSGAPAGASSQFAESQSATSLEKTKARNAPHRDLVRVVLRETMRKHGIPSDWIECRSLSVLTRQHKSGMHVQFLVRKADHQLLPYIHAFQESFWEKLLRVDPGAHEWLFSVGWEFYEKSVQGFSAMPDLGNLGGDDEAGDTLPPELADDDVASDLQALQALITAPAELTNLPDPPPRKRKA